MNYAGVDVEKKRYAIWMPVELHDDLVDYAVRNRLSFAEVLRLGGQALLELESRGSRPRLSVAIPDDFSA